MLDANNATVNDDYQKQKLVAAFEEELKALEEQRDAGIIGEAEFLDKYRVDLCPLLQ